MLSSFSILLSNADADSHVLLDFQREDVCVYIFLVSVLLYAYALS